MTMAGGRGASRSQTKCLSPAPPPKVTFQPLERALLIQTQAKEASLRAAVLSGGDFAYLGTFNNVWRHVCFSQLRVLRTSIGRSQKGF